MHFATHHSSSSTDISNVLTCYFSPIRFQDLDIRCFFSTSILCWGPAKSASASSSSTFACYCTDPHHNHFEPHFSKYSLILPLKDTVSGILWVAWTLAVHFNMPTLASNTALFPCSASQFFAFPLSAVSYIFPEQVAATVVAVGWGGGGGASTL